MIGTPVKVCIRAIPKGNGWINGPVEQYFELTDLPWQVQQDIRRELDERGFFTQDIYISDPMEVMVGMEIRKRLAAEQEATK